MHNTVDAVLLQLTDALVRLPRHHALKVWCKRDTCRHATIFDLPLLGTEDKLFSII